MMARKLWPSLRWFVFAVLVVGAIASAIAAFSPRQQPAKPVVKSGVEFPVTVMDIGEVLQHTRHEVTFRVVNHGPGSLEISDVSAGCGCTEIKVGRKYLAGGEETTIRATYSTEQARGPITQEVVAVVRNEEGLDRVQMLKITGRVQTDILTRPDRLEFTRGVGGVIELEVLPGRLKEFTVRSAVATHRAVVVNRDTNFQGDRHYVISYHPTSGDVDPNQPVFLLLDTSSVNEPQISLPILFRNP